MAGSIALYSNSPAAIWSAHGVSMASSFDLDAHCRPHTCSKPVIGGLSSLFSTPLAKFPSSTTSEALDSTCLSSYASDLCIDREGADVSLSSASRQCSPVSVFQGPFSTGSISSCSSSFIESHVSLPRKRSSLPHERRCPVVQDRFDMNKQCTPAFQGPSASASLRSCKLSGSSDSSFIESHVSFSRKRSSLPQEKRSGQERFDMNRSQNWSTFASGALVSYIECDKPLTLFEDGENTDETESPLQDEIELVFPVEDDFAHQDSDVATNRHDLDRSQINLSASSICESTESCGSCTSELILKTAISRHEMFEDPLVLKAFNEAEKAHRGQFRATGDPYLVHCVETALLVALAGASKSVVAAGLLHDILDDCSWDQKQLRESFGKDVEHLVTGVSRLSELSQLARNNNLASRTLEAGRLRTMFLSMVEVRVVLIKLADRLHNMRTLGALSEEKQKRIAHETLEIFALLANRLGTWSWKAEMEDLCFQYLNPSDYERLKKELAKGSREVPMMAAIQKLDQAMREEGIFFHDLCGRSKNLYSIYSKMLRKSRRFDEIYDVRGLRLIVPDEDACYAALDVVHRLWPHISEKLKDYIKNPKSNGYQSLHTVVIGDDELPLEIQIRSMEMHHQAEFGMAAHWRYKECDSEHSSSIVERVEWARWVLTWQNELVDSKLRLSPLEMDLRPPCPFPFHMDGCPHLLSQSRLPDFEGDTLFIIMVEDEKMGVQELPSGSTAADLLTSIYGRVPFAGNVSVPSWKENRLKINHENVNDPQQKLQMGDLIELAPFFKAEVLDKCRDSIRRMYGDDCAGVAQIVAASNLSRVKVDVIIGGLYSILCK